MHLHGAIRGDYHRQWAAAIRTLATKCCYGVTGGEHRVSAQAYPRTASQVWQEACLNPEIVGCSNACVRNKKVPRFTTDYKEPDERLPQLTVLS